MIDQIFFPEPLLIRPKPGPAGGTANVTADGGGGFARILDNKLPAREVRFSQHAQERLKSRGMTLSEADLKKLAGAVEHVAGKGGKESLIMMGDAAFVVSVKNRTVITALDRANLQGSVFTNIDSAVVI